jgi:hypothetical protein
MFHVKHLNFSDGAHRGGDINRSLNTIELGRILDQSRDIIQRSRNQFHYHEGLVRNWKRSFKSFLSCWDF